MTQAGERHLGLIFFFVTLVNRAIPPVVALLALAACAWAFGETLDLPYHVLMLVTLLLAVLLFRGSGAWATTASALIVLAGI